MELKIGDRLALLNQVLPQQGSMVDMMLSREITERVKITSEEIQESRLSENGGRITWDETLPAKPFEFNEVEMALLLKRVKQLDAEGKITALALEVCKLIQGGGK